MGSLKDIRSRIRSVKNTEQITKAMKMVAAARFRKAQSRILNLRPYADHLLSVMADAALAFELPHPLLERRHKEQRILLAVLTSDRGLCGGFNHNICRTAEGFYQAHKKQKDLEFFFIGKKAKSYFQFRGIKPVQELVNLDREISYQLALNTASALMDHFAQGRYDGIYFIYNSFQSVMSQKVVQEVFLPVDLTCASLDRQEVFSKDLIFDTPPQQLIDKLIIKHFTVQVYRCMCESVAAEYGARMTAMESAAKNAQEITARLTVEFNKLRQSSITTELIEVSSGAEAMKQ